MPPKSRRRCKLTKKKGGGYLSNLFRKNSQKTTVVPTAPSRVPTAPSRVSRSPGPNLNGYFYIKNGSLELFKDDELEAYKMLKTQLEQKAQLDGLNYYTVVSKGREYTFFVNQDNYFYTDGIVNHLKQHMYLILDGEKVSSSNTDNINITEFQEKIKLNANGDRVE